MWVCIIVAKVPYISINALFGRQPLARLRFQREFSGRRSAQEVSDSVFREVEPAVNVYRPEDPLFSPAPAGRAGNAHLAQPFIEAGQLRY